MKNKILIIFSCCMLLNFRASAAPLNVRPAENTGDGKLEDVVVKEKDAFKIEKEKPPVSISVDYMKTVMPTIKTETYFLEGQADKPETDDLNIPFTLTAKEPISPWLYSIINEPVVEFIFEKQEINPALWMLIITDKRGKPFKVYTGKKFMPSSIYWDGRDRSGHFMLAGMPYSYIFEVITKQGNKKTIIGKPFIINAVAHQENESLFINLSLKALFETKNNSLVISEDGNLLLKEVSDIVKEYYDSDVILRVYSGNKELAGNQAKLIYSYITDTLFMPKKWKNIECYSVAPENYQAEIISSGGRRPGWKYKGIVHNNLAIAIEIPSEDPSKNKQ